MRAAEVCLSVTASEQQRDGGGKAPPDTIEDSVAPPRVEDLVEHPDQPPRRLSYSVFWLSFLAVPVGVIAAYGADAFRLAFGVLSDWLLLENGFSDPLLHAMGLAAGGLLFGGILSFYKWDSFRTPAHVIVAAAERDGELRYKAGGITAVADALALGLAAPVGRYGPAVQLGATIGSQIGRRLGFTRTALRVLLGCGVAGAISASFNAPIAGAIFAHEVIIGHFGLRAFAPITMASVAAIAVTRFHGFEYIALKVAVDGKDLTLWDYPLFVLIGVLAAGVAMLYMGGITGLRQLTARWKIPVIIQPLLGGVVAGACGLALPLVLGLGDTTIQQVLAQDVDDPAFAWQMLLLLMTGKLVASVACLGMKYPGGAFSPAIFMGALLGGACAFMAPFLDHQICALVGMGALVSSVVGAPISTILIVFELTENYAAATAVMVAVVAANALVTRFFARSLFHRQIRHWGIDLDRPREQRLMERQTVADIMSKRFFAVRPDRPVSRLRRLVDRGHRGDVYVTDEDGRLIGKLPLATLAIAEEDATAAELCGPPTPWLRRNDDLWNSFVSIENLKGYFMPVVEDAESMRLIGTVTASDFIRAYRKAVREGRESAL